MDQLNGGYLIDGTKLESLLFSEAFAMFEIVSGTMAERWPSNRESKVQLLFETTFTKKIISFFFLLGCDMSWQCLKARLSF